MSVDTGLYYRGAASYTLSGAAWRGIVDTVNVGDHALKKVSGSAYHPSFAPTSAGNSSTVYSGIELREANFARAQTGSLAEAPRISFYWADRFASQIVLDTTGKFRLSDEGGTGLVGLTAATVSVNRLEVDNAIILDTPNNNTARGPWNPIWLAARGGKRIAGLEDEDFREGTNSVGVYNNSGGGALVINRVADSTAPNASGFVLEIVNNGGTTSPALGGFYQIYNSAANKIYVQVFRAKIPVGYTLADAANSQGTNATGYWLSNTVGTGKWEEYIRVSNFGDSGSFGTGGHVYLTGPAGAVTWHVASCTAYDVTASNWDAITTRGGTIVGDNRLIFGPNSGYGGSLAIGGTGPISFTGTTGGIVVTNGNLHIDSGTDKAVYLNLYSGTGGVKFGDGASGVAADVSAAGLFTGTGISAPSFNSFGTSGVSKRVSNPSGGGFGTVASTVTGALRIILPVNYNACMMMFTIKIYEYASIGRGTSREIVVGGHPFVGQWYNYFAYQLTDGGEEINVRFGDTGSGNICVWVGDTGTAWHYPQVFITDVEIGYNATTPNWHLGWDLSFQTSFNTVTNGPIVVGKNINSQNLSLYIGSSSNWTTRPRWVTSMLGWNAYGDNHVIIDGSQGLAPNGASISNIDSAVAWTGTYPILMGWNGTSTYGVKVDRSREAEGIASGFTVPINRGGTGATTGAAASEAVANFGQLRPHTTVTDFNLVQSWGSTFVQASGNAPAGPHDIQGNTRTQFYQTTLSLGSDYVWGTADVYAAQTAFARDGVSPYLYVRYKNGGNNTANWGSWTKFAAGKSDTVSNINFTTTLNNNAISDSNLALTGGITAHYVTLNDPNKPDPSVTDHALLSIAYSSAWAIQMAGDWRTNRWFLRNKEANVWEPWTEIVTAANVATMAAPASTTDLARWSFMGT